MKHLKWLSILALSLGFSADVRAETESPSDDGTGFCLEKLMTVYMDDLKENWQNIERHFQQVKEIQFEDPEINQKLMKLISLALDKKGMPELWLSRIHAMAHELAVASFRQQKVLIDPKTKTSTQLSGELYPHAETIRVLPNSKGHRYNKMADRLKKRYGVDLYYSPLLLGEGVAAGFFHNANPPHIILGAGILDDPARGWLSLLHEIRHSHYYLQRKQSQPSVFDARIISNNDHPFSQHPSKAYTHFLTLEEISTFAADFYRWSKILGPKTDMESLFQKSNIFKALLEVANEQLSRLEKTIIDQPQVLTPVFSKPDTGYFNALVTIENAVFDFGGKMDISPYRPNQMDLKECLEKDCALQWTDTETWKKYPAYVQTLQKIKNLLKIIDAMERPALAIQVQLGLHQSTPDFPALAKVMEQPHLILRRLLREIEPDRKSVRPVGNKPSQRPKTPN